MAVGQWNYSLDYRESGFLDPRIGAEFAQQHYVEVPRSLSQKKAQWKVTSVLNRAAAIRCERFAQNLPRVRALGPMQEVEESFRQGRRTRLGPNAFSVRND